MMSRSDDTQADVIEALNSTSRYLDDLLNIDNPYFEGMLSQIYPAGLQFWFWFFGDFRCGVPLFIVIPVIYKY